MPLKNDIDQAKADIYDAVNDIENELVSFTDKLRFKIGIALPLGWWFFGAGFTLSYLLAALFGVG